MQMVSLDITAHRRARGDHRTFTNTHAWQDLAPSSDANTFPDIDGSLQLIEQGVDVKSILTNSRPAIVAYGNQRPDEDVISNPSTWIDG